MSFDASSLAKAPYKKQNWTAQQLTEFALCTDPESGPHYFMSNFFFIQHPVQGKMQYQPFDYQKRLIETYHNYRYAIAMMPRQSGKCLQEDSNINIMNNKTGKQYNIPIGIYYKFMQAQRDGTEIPNISKYEVKKL